jgi:hypothetical protein
MDYRDSGGNFFSRLAQEAFHDESLVYFRKNIPSHRQRLPARSARRWPPSRSAVSNINRTNPQPCQGIVGGQEGGMWLPLAGADAASTAASASLAPHRRSGLRRPCPDTVDPSRMRSVVKSWRPRSASYERRRALLATLTNPVRRPGPCPVDRRLLFLRAPRLPPAPNRPR